MGQFFDTNPQKTVLVKSARADHKVVLWEKSPHHPGGEVMIGGDSIVLAALTPRVCEVLSEGSARVVTDEEAEEAARQQAEIAERARAHEAFEAKRRRRNLYITAVGTDAGFEEAYAAGGGVSG